MPQFGWLGTGLHLVGGLVGGLSGLGWFQRYHNLAGWVAVGWWVSRLGWLQTYHSLAGWVAVGGLVGLVGA